MEKTSLREQHIGEEDAIDEDSQLLKREVGPLHPQAALDEIFIALKNACRTPSHQEKFPPHEQRFDPLEKGMQNFVASLLDPEQRIQMEQKIERANPRLAQLNLFAAMQARIADLVFSHHKNLPDAVLKRLDDFFRRGGLRIEGTLFDLVGAKNAGAAMAIFAQEPDTEYYYPHPLIDTITKGDIITYNEGANRYTVWQIKTARLADALPRIISGQTFSQLNADEREDALGIPKDRASKLAADLTTLDAFAETLQKRFSENFDTKLLVLPSPQSPRYHAYFDWKTGLPNDDFFAMLEKQRGDDSPSNLAVCATLTEQRIKELSS